MIVARLVDYIYKNCFLPLVLRAGATSRPVCSQVSRLQARNQFSSRSSVFNDSRKPPRTRLNSQQQGATMLWQQSMGDGGERDEEGDWASVTA